MLVVDVGLLLTPNVAVKNASIVVEEGYIKRMAAGGERKIGAEKLEYMDCIAAPGFIDIHTHGYGGIDVNYLKNEKDLMKMSEMLVKHGVTMFLPTTVSFPIEKLKEIAKISKHKNVRLMCYEKEFPCHRFILIEIIKEIAER